MKKANGTFRPVPKTGVIYVMSEAAKRGFNEERALWANFGQGAPETGELEGAPDRITNISFTTDEHEYTPVAGLSELREAVAELYNERFRQNKKSKYTKDNVTISAGGRVGITRIVSTLGRTNVGHFIPDYTAYEELLDAFGTFVPIPILTKAENDYAFSAESLKEEILGRGSSAVLLSNPCNPTGKLRQGKELAEWIEVARELNCSMIFDEFYSHYIYDSDTLSVSAAEHVEDVDQDPVIIVDGLTKNWRYPGFRVSWTIGPKDVIEACSSAGSFIDGGCSRPMQKAALELVKKDVADKEARAIKSVFTEKRELLVTGLRELGIKVPYVPEGAFYCWGDVSGLSDNINSDQSFFEKALDEKVVVVPGNFFDINPGYRRPDRPGRFNQYVRFSFGPPKEELELGLNSLKKVIEG